jgi:hypothetical protein
MLFALQYGAAEIAARLSGIISNYAGWSDKGVVSDMRVGLKME